MYHMYNNQGGASLEVTNYNKDKLILTANIANKMHEY